MVKGRWPGLGIDTSQPNVARIYDYWLGGKDNFAVDREAAERQARAVPQLPWLARQNRDFLQRVVRFCAGQGITQFLDIGSGLPTSQNVHEVARQARPDARVVYVDIDPVVVSHAKALLSGEHVAAVRGDLSRPDDILAADEVRRLIDFSQPVAILLLAILHVIPDQADPFGSVARLRDVMAPGSYLAISHADVSVRHVVGTRRLTDAARVIEQASKAEDVPARTRDQIAGFFGDLALVEPGLTDVWAWRPEAAVHPMTTDFMRIIGAVARKGWRAAHTPLLTVLRTARLPGAGWEGGAFPDGDQRVHQLVQIGVGGVGGQHEHAVLAHGDQGADGRPQAPRVGSAAMGLITRSAVSMVGSVRSWRAKAKSRSSADAQNSARMIVPCSR